MPWDVDKSVAYVHMHARPAYDPKTCGHCARSTTFAIKAAALTLINTEEAKNYGAGLRAAEFTELNGPKDTSFEKDDIVLIQGFKERPHGQMATFDGSKWISGFRPVRAVSRGWVSGQ